MGFGNHRSRWDQTQKTRPRNTWTLARQNQTSHKRRTPRVNWYKTIFKYNQKKKKKRSFKENKQNPDGQNPKNIHK